MNYFNQIFSVRLVNVKMESKFFTCSFICFVFIGGNNALNKKEIAAFKSRPWIESNTNVQGWVRITDNGAVRLQLESNGIPDHPTGAFGGSQAAPNYIKEQNNLWYIPKKPTEASSTTCLPMGPIGMAINGVAIYNSFTRGCCDAGEAELNLFDTCWGHPSPDNRYHYHTAPLCVFEVDCNQASDIVGVAFDGFPIYGPIDEDGNELKSADLDECHGKYALDGSYRYHITADYPYTLGCYKGTPITNMASNCECDVNNPTDPCTEFEGPPPRPWVLNAILTKNRMVLYQMLGLKTNGSFSCCADPNDCDYVYNINTVVPNS